MDGNSLGRLPRATVPHLHHVVEEAWGAQLIRGWGTGWYEAPQRIGDRLGTLLGAAAGQVLMCDSTSVNLFKVLMAALDSPDHREHLVELDSRDHRVLDSRDHRVQSDLRDRSVQNRQDSCSCLPLVCGLRLPLLRERPFNMKLQPMT